jgi:hypothetical protein
LQPRRDFAAPGIGGRITAGGVIIPREARFIFETSAIVRLDGQVERHDRVIVGRKISQAGSHLSALYSIPWS